MIARLRLPLSFRARPRNLPQEAGSNPASLGVNMRSMEFRTAAVAANRFDLRLFDLAQWLLIALLLFLLWTVSLAHLHAAVVATPRVTLVVFSDKPIPEDEWVALSSAMEKAFANLAVETHFMSGGFEVVRGETVRPGEQFEGIISVFLHGDCRLFGQPDQQEVSGALGWVLRDHDEIEPFIHVDCMRIAAMLNNQALWMNRSVRNAAMAEAISRVVLHEWVHIATQSAAHTRDGLEKRSFSVTDLIPNHARMIPRSGGK